LTEIVESHAELIEEADQDEEDEAAG